MLIDRLHPWHFLYGAGISTVSVRSLNRLLRWAARPTEAVLLSTVDFLQCCQSPILRRRNFWILCYCHLRWCCSSLLGGCYRHASRSIPFPSLASLCCAGTTARSCKSKEPSSRKALHQPALPGRKIRFRVLTLTRRLRASPPDGRAARCLLLALPAGSLTHRVPSSCTTASPGTARLAPTTTTTSTCRVTALVTLPQLPLWITLSCQKTCRREIMSSVSDGTVRRRHRYVACCRQSPFPSQLA